MQMYRRNTYMKYFYTQELVECYTVYVYHLVYACLLDVQPVIYVP